MAWKRISGFRKPKTRKKLPVVVKLKAKIKDVPIITYQGKEWELWTEIPPWSDRKPRDAVREASKDHSEVAVKRISRYGKVSIQILVRR